VLTPFSSLFFPGASLVACAAGTILLTLPRKPSYLLAWAPITLWNVLGVVPFFLAILLLFDIRGEGGEAAGFAGMGAVLILAKTFFFILGVILCAVARPKTGQIHRPYLVAAILLCSVLMAGIWWQARRVEIVRVLDSDGKPLAQITVHYEGGDELEGRTIGSAETDADGNARVQGYVNQQLSVSVETTNYYFQSQQSAGINFAEGAKKRPVVFYLRKKDHPVPLISYGGGLHAPNDGTVANFPLRGNTRPEIIGQLQIQGWNHLSFATNSNDWKVQLTVPNGGIIESTNQFDFVAPDNGYPKNVDFQESGSKLVKKRFFIKLQRGYIRFNLEVEMGKDMFVSGNYYFNPTGSQNLEPVQ
jgi:hypothetical protein